MGQEWNVMQNVPQGRAGGVVNDKGSLLREDDPNLNFKPEWNLEGQKKGGHKGRRE